VPPQAILSTVRDYYPFGLDALAATDPERMRFAGHERETRATLSQTDDLDYMLARYYSPVVGRFLSVDPSRSFTIFGPQSFNLYTYVGNNPVGYVDPLGLRPEVADGIVISEVVVVGDTSQEDTAAEADRRRESAKRAEAELRRMRLRAGDTPSRATGEYSTYDLESLVVNSWRGIAAFEDEVFLFGTIRPFERLGLYDSGAIGTDWSGIAGSVVGDLAMIAGGTAAAGLEVNVARYARSGGGGFNVLRGETRLLGLDWHRFKKYGTWMNRPHLHLKGLKGKHWPW
jgi:RHS repeat-associated protein